MLVRGSINGSSRWGAAILVLVMAVTGGSVVGAATTSDGSASSAETPSPVIQFPQCENETIGGQLHLMGDSFCDTHSNNVAECGFDGGDCCECTCVDLDKPYSCLDFQCKDTEAECYVAPSPTPSPIITLDSSAVSQRVLSPALSLAYGVCLIALGAVAW